MNDVMMAATVTGNELVVNNAGCNNGIWNEPLQNNPNGYWVDGVWYTSFPQPTFPTWYPPPAVCCCAAHSFCLKCFVDAMEKLKGSPMLQATPTKTLADTLLTQAKARLDEIQKRLDEVSALEAEKARLQKIVAAAE